MATSIFNADSSEVTGTSGVVKSGSTYVMTGTSAQIDIIADAGAGKAYDHSTAQESKSGVGAYLLDSSPTAVETSYRKGYPQFVGASAFDTDLSLVGNADDGAWQSIFFVGTPVDQRLAYDRGVDPDPANGGRLSNIHWFGTYTARSVKNTEIYGSDNAGDYTGDYATDNAMVLLWSGVVPQHSALNEADWYDLTFTSLSSHRYLIFKFADNWGDITAMGIRRFEVAVPLAIDYDLTDDSGATNYINAGDISAVQSVSNTGFQNEGTRLHITGAIGAVWNSYTIDDYNTDVTPPDDPVGGKSYDSDIWGMWWPQSTDDTAITRMKKVVDGTTTYLAEVGGFPVFQSAEPTTTWYTFSRSDLTASSQINAYEADDIVATSVAYWVKHVDTSGNESAWVVLTNETLDTLTTPTGFTIADVGDYSGNWLVSATADAGNTVIVLDSDGDEVTAFSADDGSIQTCALTVGDDYTAVAMRSGKLISVATSAVTAPALATPESVSAGTIAINGTSGTEMYIGYTPNAAAPASSATLHVIDYASGSETTYTLVSGSNTITIVPGAIYLFAVSYYDASGALSGLGSFLFIRAVSTGEGDDFTVYWKTDYDADWESVSFNSTEDRIRIPTNRRGHWLQWEIRGDAQNQRFELQNTGMEVRLAGPSYGARQS